MYLKGKIKRRDYITERKIIYYRSISIIMIDPS